MKQLTILLFILFPSITFSQSEKSLSESETYRPEFHFSPVEGWMSDPNGLVYYEGEYHLFYQHMPAGPFNGLHWGHAVSKDLLHWEHLPIALYPDTLGYIFSGCCVVDHTNSSGLGNASSPPLLAYFTYHNPVSKVETQALAFSNDKGRTWEKYAGNPVIQNPGIKDFRDPKVIWDSEKNRWMMALAAGPVIKFYESRNGIDWEYLSEFGVGSGSHVGPWECPDFFPMQVKGTDEVKWVLLVSVVDFTDTPSRLSTATQYFMGDFDGTNFTCKQTDTLWIDYGKDCYAGVTFDNAPDNRRIFLAWMNSHQYAGHARKAITKSWSGAATFPRELSVTKKAGSYRLEIEPVKELIDLYAKQATITPQTIQGNVTISDKLPFKTSPIEMRLQFATSELPKKYGFRLKNAQGEHLTIYFDRDRQAFYTDRTKAAGFEFHEQFASLQSAPFTPGNTMQWQALIDAGSIELFTGDHMIVFSNIYFPTTPFDTIELFSEGGSIHLNEGIITSLQPIWVTKDQ